MRLQCGCQYQGQQWQQLCPEHEEEEKGLHALALQRRSGESLVTETKEEKMADEIPVPAETGKAQTPMTTTKETKVKKTKVTEAKKPKKAAAKKANGEYRAGSMAAQGFAVFKAAVDKLTAAERKELPHGWQAEVAAKLKERFKIKSAASYVQHYITNHGKELGL